MPMVQFQFTYDIPNELCVDHSFTNGNTRTTTYDGPDKLFFIVDENGKEELGPVTEIEKNDGRPVPDNCRWVEIDCIDNPVLCQLRGPIIDEEEEDHTGEATPSTGATTVSGYKPFTYQTPVLPYQFLDPLAIVFNADNTYTIPVREPRDTVMGLDVHRDITWDDLRAKRDMLLKNSDSELQEDMPADLKNQWKDYRQRLRDWPTAMQNAGNSPLFAYYMEPIQVGADPVTGMIDPDTTSIVM